MDERTPRPAINDPPPVNSATPRLGSRSRPDDMELPEKIEGIYRELNTLAGAPYPV